MAIEDVFRVSIASSKCQGDRELGEFETVMQTRDAVSGLHNCREFSQFNFPECLDEAMEIRKMSSIAIVIGDSKFLLHKSDQEAKVKICKV